MPAWMGSALDTLQEDMNLTWISGRSDLMTVIFWWDHLGGGAALQLTAPVLILCGLLLLGCGTCRASGLPVEE